VTANLHTLLTSRSVKCPGSGTVIGRSSKTALSCSIWANKSDALLPTDRKGRGEVVEWVFAALNSVEMASLPWSLFKFSGDTTNTPMGKQFDDFLKARLGHVDRVLEDREWLTRSFSIADIVMADVLRLVDRFDRLANHSAKVPRRFVARRLYDKDFVVAMRKGHAFARNPSLSAFCRMDHLLVSLSGDPHGFVDLLLAKRGLTRRVALTYCADLHDGPRPPRRLRSDRRTAASPFPTSWRALRSRGR